MSGTRDRVEVAVNHLPPAGPAAVVPGLTEREREVLSPVAQHRTNPEIARRLVLSQKTARGRDPNILSKLQVADRAEAIIGAREAGLGRERTQSVKV